MSSSKNKIVFSVVLLGLSACTWSAFAADRLPKVRVAPDKSGFVTADGKPFVPFGVNYFRPGTGWAPQLWKKFDAEATKRDFQIMRELGVNCVRVFLSYGSFMTRPDAIDAEGLAKFDKFLEMADEAGIYVHPTGPDHWEGAPGWATRDRMSDEHMQALEKFWTQLAARYRDRSVLFAYDLLNEPSVPWTSESLQKRWNSWLQSEYKSPEALAEAWNVPKDQIHWGNEAAPDPSNLRASRKLLDYQRVRESLADEWTRRQTQAIKQSDPDSLVTVGCIQWAVPVILPGLQHYAAFRPERQAPLLDFMEIHFYPLANGFFEYTPEGEAQNLAYLQSVVREVAACGKPVVLAEFGWYGGGKLTIDGGRHPEKSDEEQARWCRRAVEETTGLATGWLNWGLYDHPESQDVTQLTGLLTSNGTPKAWAREFKKLASRLSQQTPAKLPADNLPKLDWDRSIVDQKAGREFLEAYRQAARIGK
jgi:sugar phosphate isomerase/epimerase